MRSAPIPTLPLGLILGTTALASLMLAAPHARANTLNVSASVPADCTVQAGTLDFGTYDPVANKNGAGSFTVTCSVNASVDIGMDAGLQSDGTSRKVANGSGDIRYFLFKDSNRSEEWGDNSSYPATSNVVPIEGGGIARTVDVYGQLVAGGARPAGVYTDVVGITFTVN